MVSTISADLCVIGAGSAGNSVVAGAAQMGARTVLIEADRMGGDCLNTGCVPSKSLIAAAKVAATMRHAGRFGVHGGEPNVDFPGVHRHVHDVITAIAPHDSVERFTGLGCTVIQARARFVDDRTVEAGEQHICARRFVIATASRAGVSPIPGLDGVPFFTNETFFDNARLPQHLVIIGAGPIGCEMAQAHRRLGARVSLLDLGPMLPKDDPELVTVVREAFLAIGIDLIEGIEIRRIESRPPGIAVVIANEGDGERVVEGSHLLIAAGQRPNVEDLGLEAAGVHYGPKGIEVDRRLRTSNRRIYAAGDVAGDYQFTHLAAYHAGIVLRNALFRLPAKVDTRALPWVTYTDPELAHVGLTEAQARDAIRARMRVLRSEFAGNDRARTERTTGGLIKVVVNAEALAAAHEFLPVSSLACLLSVSTAISAWRRCATTAWRCWRSPKITRSPQPSASCWYTPVWSLFHCLEQR